MTHFKKAIIWNGTNDLDVNSEGRADVVQHAHPNNGGIHFHVTNINATQDFILIDISDTTNYPHVDTDYIHLESFLIGVDSDTNGDYEIEVGFLDNVDGTNGDFHGVYTLSGTKKAGNTQSQVFDGYPNAPRCNTDSFLSSDKSLNDTAFQTDVNLASTLDPSTIDTPSGDGDLVVRVTRNAGTFNLSINLSYHTH